MKKLIVMAVLLAALMGGARATYADGGWATAGKVLTGVFAADILFNHIGPAYAGYGYGYGPYGGVAYYGPPPVYYAPAPVYYAPAPPVYYYGYGYPRYSYPRYYRPYPHRRW